jgi:dihydroorotate dehydrogenase (NAD+) catalytic subunit
MNDPMPNGPDLRTTIGGLVLKNPVLTASGAFGYGREFMDLIDLDRLGGIILKGVSLSPTRGNPPPRVVETASGMLNAIGLENVGFDALVREKLPILETLDAPVFINLYGTTVEEYAALAAASEEVDRIDAVEVNISCPNVKAGGAAFGVDPASAAAVTAAVRSRTTKPVMVKLSPNVADVAAIARSVEDAGADAVSLINTLTGMAVDLKTRRPVLANVTGGLSGPAIKPVALRMVWQAAGAVSIPVVGIGGIMTAEDALEFLTVGASAVQVGTANFVDPSASVRIIEGIKAFLSENGIGRVTDMVGALTVRPVLKRPHGNDP